VRGEFHVIRWWAGEKLSKRETRAPDCEHDGSRRVVEDGLLVCKQCGWEVV